MLKAPFPWFGGKSRAAPIIWPRLGEVRNYVEPFAGSLAVLLARPDVIGTETINDLDCYVANFWRALHQDPEGVAHHADNPVNEADLHARHLWLVNQVAFRERMKTDPFHFDSRIAGWWVWGISCWIGGGWCAIRERPWKQRPNLPADHGGQGGQGVHRKLPDVNPKGFKGSHGKRPLINATKSGPGIRQALFQSSIPIQVPALGMGAKGSNRIDDLVAWFQTLADRLRSVRVTCGDWTRVMGDTPLGLTTNVADTFKTAVVLDPPYHGDVRDSGLYATDSDDISTAVREWAIAHGDHPRLRIALCGYEQEHAMPASWECVAWKANGGYGNRSKNQNAHLERIWFSPHCLKPQAAQQELFAPET